MIRVCFHTKRYRALIWLTYAPWSFANRLIALLPIDASADNNLRVLYPDPIVTD